MNNDIAKIRNLIPYLNRARKAYYEDNEEIMSNKEYDALFDELKALEEKTGLIYPNSPTQEVGYISVSSLSKVEHVKKMLSLNKTKEVEELCSFLGVCTGLLSYKLDGLTVVLEYDKGSLVRALTRGNGEVGEDVTHNVKVFSNLPKKISYKGELIIRGEAVISEESFTKINAAIENVEDRYKNPRNLCSGSVRQLDNKVCAERKVQWIGFEVVKGFGNLYKHADLADLDLLGFETVPRLVIGVNSLEDAVGMMTKGVSSYAYGVDGLVLTVNDKYVANNMGTTSHHPLDSMAFKWADECVETTLIDVEWQTTRTGTINPVAVFEPVDIEGTTVERASLHNLDIFNSLQLGKGDTITVYKANMIIPQVDQNLTKSCTLETPDCCPSCGGDVEEIGTDKSKFLVCANEDCKAKLVSALSHFVSRDCMNIDGLSEASLEAMFDAGIIKYPIDLYCLEISNIRDKLIGLPKWGEKKVDKLLKNIEASKKVKIPNFIKALGIEGVGASFGKKLCERYDNDPKIIFSNEDVTLADLLKIDGVGESLALSYRTFLESLKYKQELSVLIDYMEFDIPVKEEGSVSLDGATFVITGKVVHFDNRNAVKDKIESLGGKVSGSVSKKTDYLINNDSHSSSSKNKKAKDLGVKIITEDEFLSMIGV